MTDTQTQVEVQTNPDDLLVEVNKYVQEPYNAARHLFNAIKQERGGSYSWPKDDDTDGWLEARTLAIQHRKKVQQEPPDGNGSEPAAAPEAEAVPVDEGVLAAACIALPEAPVVMFSDFISPEGARWCITVRAGLRPELARAAVTQTIDLAKTVERGALSAGWHTPGNGNGRKAAPVQPPAAPGATPPPVAGAPPVVGGNGDGEVQSGTAALNKLTVDADGRVEFYVGNFRWPFKDARGGEVVAGLFDKDLGWISEHFQPGANYQDEVNGLQVDWEKPGKYYDVVRVHR